MVDTRLPHEFTIENLTKTLKTFSMNEEDEKIRKELTNIRETINEREKEIVPSEDDDGDSYANCTISL